MSAKEIRPTTRPHAHTFVFRSRVRSATTYRVAAVPSCATESDDILLSDGAGRTYLFSEQDPEPSPLEPAEANSLGMFFEPSQDSSWHTLGELRALFYGVDASSA
jgi:hypothetical protein